MTPATTEHVRWLLAAVRAGACRHDPFEIVRHFDVPASAAVELGARLHDVSGGPRAMASPDAAEVACGDVVIRYRAVDGSERRISAPQSPDGRLGMPSFG